MRILLNAGSGSGVVVRLAPEILLLWRDAFKNSASDYQPDLSPLRQVPVLRTVMFRSQARAGNWHLEFDPALGKAHIVHNWRIEALELMKQRPASSFSFIEPMKALLVPALPVGDWLYEIKFDGYRALAFKSGSDVQLVSRNRTSFNKVYPQLIDALKSLPAKNAIIDGEIAALDQHGKPSFQLLQAYGKSKETPLIYYAFDLLELEGKDLRNRPLVERRKLLANLLQKAPDNIRFSEELRGTRDRFFEAPIPARGPGRQAA
jgi:ATP-dependent DNA ligase